MKPYYVYVATKVKLSLSCSLFRITICIYLILTQVLCRISRPQWLGWLPAQQLSTGHGGQKNKEPNTFYYYSQQIV